MVRAPVVACGEEVFCMRFRKRLVVTGIAAVVAAWCAMGGVAAATFPNFSDCPSAGLPSGSICVDIQSVQGELEIKGFRVPLDHSLEIRGAVTNEGVFIPPRGTNGFFAEPVRIPGGLLGLELPFGFNTVLATAELAGSPSQIVIHAGEQMISMPLKVRLSNVLLGRNCHIGSNRTPVQLNLIPGTTEPPPPNRPITGRFGTLEFIPPNLLISREGTDVENSFAIPGAQECGGLLELNNALIDLKLRIPSAAGNNAVSITNEAGVLILP
jgi:hypothetical protein